MATHAVVLLYDPPAILDVLATLVLWVIEECSWHIGSFCSHAAQQERGQLRAPLRFKERLWHSQPILGIFLLTLIVDGGLGNLMFKEAFVVVPGLFLIFRMQVQRVLAFFSPLR